MITVINASAAVTLLEQRPEKIRALNDILRCGAVLSQLSYQSHMRAVVCGLALYMWTLYLTSWDGTIARKTFGVNLLIPNFLTYLVHRIGMRYCVHTALRH